MDPRPAPWLGMDASEYAASAARLSPAFLELMRAEGIPPQRAEDLQRLCLPLAAWAHGQKPQGKPLVLGVNGAQGSGKSTLCLFLRLVLRHAYGYRVATLSLDDLYKTRAERMRMAREIHPLFATRGPPGTHDTEMGLAVLDALTAPAEGSVALPAFDKARDDRRPLSAWPHYATPADIVLFEGWCVGAVPQPDCALCRPVNRLEREEDAFGIWRRYANRRLQDSYAPLFARVDRLLMLKAPGFESVRAWRALQERKLAAKTAADARDRLMDAAALERFLMHYERVTRHCLTDMPQRADMVLFLNAEQLVSRIDVRASEKI